MIIHTLLQTNSDNTRELIRDLIGDAHKGGAPALNNQALVEDLATNAVESAIRTLQDKTTGVSNDGEAEIALIIAMRAIQLGMEAIDSFMQERIKDAGGREGLVNTLKEMGIDVQVMTLDELVDQSKAEFKKAEEAKTQQ